jgi:hypothetical protein
VDFSIYTQEGNEDLLGDGDARQELRKLMDAVLIAEAENALKKRTYEGAIRLADKGFITPNELENRKIDFEKSQNSLASTRASLQLFKTYNIQKEAEQYLLNYELTLMRLSRAKKDAIAEMADSIGDLNRAERAYRWEKSNWMIWWNNSRPAPSGLNALVSLSTAMDVIAGILMKSSGKEQESANVRPSSPFPTCDAWRSWCESTNPRSNASKKACRLKSRWMPNRIDP